MRGGHEGGRGGAHTKDGACALLGRLPHGVLLSILELARPDGFVVT